MDQLTFLTNLRRSAARSGIAPQSARGHDSSVASASDRADDVVSRFVDRVRASGATPFSVPTWRAARTGVEELIAERGWRRVVCPAGVTWPGPPWQGASEANEAEFGLTVADWAVAETGSVLVESSPEADRRCSLLPPVTGFFVPRDRILPAMGPALRLLERPPRDVPSSSSFITGPSRTGDLVGQIVVGVHGALEVLVWIVDEPVSASMIERRASVDG